MSQREDLAKALMEIDEPTRRYVIAPYRHETPLADLQVDEAGIADLVDECYKSGREGSLIARSREADAIRHMIL